MGLNIGVEVKDGLMLVTASGNLTRDAALRLLKEVCDAAAEKKVDKMLVNGLNIVGGISTLERYQLGTELAAWHDALQAGIRW